MRLEIGLFLKNARLSAVRCSRPRHTTLAISQLTHWLIGRSLSDAFAQVIATTTQICAGMKAAGASPMWRISEPLGNRLSIGGLPLSFPPICT